MRESLTRLARAGAVVTVVFSFATFANPLHRHLDQFSHFRVQYLAAAAILCAALLLLRSRRWAVVMALVACINAVPVVPWYAGAAQRPPDTSATLKLLVSNVYAGNTDTDSLVALIREEAPDLVFLQEVTLARLDSLAPLRESFPYVHAVPRDDNFGIAVLSRRQFLGARTIESPPLGYPTLVVEVQLGDAPVTFVSTHPSPPIGNIGFDARNRQFLSVATLLAEIGGPLAVVGDLNSTMWGYHYRDFVASTGLANTRKGIGVLPTWPVFFPPAMIPIDHCLVRGGLAAVSMKTGPDIGSDHLPLIVTLGL